MSFYDDASLIMYPSGYKASKLYSLKPTDGSGDLTFTRASTATRVNSAGLIEKVRTNLLTQSQNFTSGWSGAGITATANFGVAPDGTTTSTRLVFSGVSQIWQKPVTGATGIGVFSLFIKGTAGETIQIAYGGVTDKLITLGTGWNRFNTDGNVALTTAMFINTFGGVTARTIEVWGGQVELGDIATPYIPTTTTAVSVGMLADIPRIDYTGGGCGKLLLEPQRTNLVLFSEQFDNAGWSKLRGAITANSAISPDGYQNADLFIPDTTNNNHTIFTTITSGQRTFSVFAKSSGYNYIFLGVNNNAASDGVFFDLSNGTISQNTSGLVANITPFGNGWYRCDAYSNTWGTLAVICTSQNGTSFIHTGNGTSGVYIYGAQLEAGSYPTSYIPTLASSVTRLADAAFKTGISALIGQTQGTLFVDSILTHSAASNQYLIQVSASASNRFFIYREGTTNKIGCFALIGSTQIYTQLTAAAITGRFKAAFTYQSGNFAFYVNGIQIGTSAATFAAPPSMGRLDIDQNIGLENGYYSYNQAIVFPTRLTNTQLASLTTL